MSMYVTLGILLLTTVIFSAVVLGYFLASKSFQSENRSGDGGVLLIAGGLFIAFTASFIEIFDFAFRLPFSEYVDLGIGLASVVAAVLAAQAVFAVFSRNASVPVPASKDWGR
ncbi:hypothetical protein [uncultured Roseibium sp.]|uniref:hypothetical protein n=1 Tax=uncultured Roseibium sp. TaxID=1936171 RepID=UPI00260F8C3B|nr:hypothetical protein [uncultured Roseibium sp.]